MTFARNFGGIIDRYQGLRPRRDAALRRGDVHQGGMNMQRRLLRHVQRAESCPATHRQSDRQPGSAVLPSGDAVPPGLQTVGSHTLPVATSSISGTYQLSTGPNIIATWNAPNSVIAPALGRNLAAGATATKSIH